MSDLLDRSMEAGTTGPGRRQAFPTTFRKSCWWRIDAHPEGAAISAQLLCGKEPHKGVNPDEVVAVGAACKARCWAEK